jgi:hypothetical protein
LYIIASSLGWVSDPFVLRVTESEKPPVVEGELMEIWNDRTLELKNSSTEMVSFWLSLRQDYPSSYRRQQNHSFLYIV